MVIVFGSINLDLIFRLPNIPRPGETVLGSSTRIEPGGKGANQAVAAARDGATVIMAGAVGRDALADGALSLLRAAGVDLDRVRPVEASTGCAAIAVDPDGNNAIAVGSGANLSAQASQVEDSLLGPNTDRGAADGSAGGGDGRTDRACQGGRRAGRAEPGAGGGAARKTHCDRSMCWSSTKPKGRGWPRISAATRPPLRCATGWAGSPWCSPVAARAPTSPAATPSGTNRRSR